MPRASRVFVLFSLALAVGAYALSLSVKDPRDVYLVAGVALLAASGARLAPRWTTTVLLALVFVAPGLLRSLLSGDSGLFHTIWLVAAAAWLIAEAPLAGWSIPPRWQRLLTWWLLVVAISWPVVYLRELDFRPSLDMLQNTYSNGLAPERVALWASRVAGAAMSVLVGGLWCDRLFARYSGPVPLPDFSRQVVLPLGAGFVAVCLVGLYQSWVDPSWLSYGVWISEKRATGTLLDGNGLGMIAGTWSVVLAGWLAAPASETGKPGSTLSGPLKEGLHRPVIAYAALILLLGCLGVFASGSRTGFAAFAIGCAFLGSTIASRAQLAALAGVAVVILSLLGVGARSGLLQTASPVRRLAATLPSPTSSDVVDFARSMWSRGGWGFASVAAVEEHPLTGVGVGTFAPQSMDYAYRLKNTLLSPDNAQNWWRQQAAEFGVVGAVFAVGLTLFMLRLLARRAPPSLKTAAGGVRGALVGLAVASLFGVPTQVPAVAFSAWTFLFLSVRLLEGRETQASRTLSRPGVVAIFLLVVAVGAGQLYAGTHSLRPPMRAMQTGVQYGYGFWRGGTTTAGEPYWWTEKHAVFVFPVTSGILEFSATPMHPDIARDPVRIQIWFDGHRLVDREARDNTPIPVRVPARPSQRAVFLETRVSRTFTAQTGGGEARGLLIQRRQDQ